jgi:hypothetical protein
MLPLNDAGSGQRPAMAELVTGSGSCDPLRRPPSRAALLGMTALPDDVTKLLDTQHGLITLVQCRDAGLEAPQVRNLVRAERWVRVAPSIYSVVHHRTTWLRKLWVAHLHAGPTSVVSHESAGRLHHFAQVPAGRVVLMDDGYRRHGPEGVRRHRADDLRPDHITEIAGLPVTTPLRTIVDLAAVLHIARVRHLVEDVVNSHRFSVAAIGATLDEVRRPGKPGVAKLARVLDDHGPGRGVPRSELERLLDDVIRLSGLPAPVHEHPLPGGGAIVGFVDRCRPDAKLIVEADGRKWHTRRVQASLDATRSLQAQSAGFETTRLLWEHLAHDPEGTAELLRSVHLQRTDLLRRAAS